MAQQHILSAVESEITSSKDKGDPTERDLSVTLDERDLWVRFQCFTNEMIVTKSGRLIFTNQFFICILSTRCLLTDECFQL